MSAKLLLEYADITGLILSMSVLVAMVAKRLIGKYRALALYCASTVILECVQIPLFFFRRYTGISVATGYKIVFNTNEIIAALQSVLVMLVIYNVFHQAISPLKGLHRMGTLVFKWVGGVSLMLGLVIALGPHVFTTGLPSTVAVTTVIERAQEGMNVLTLCLLLFVCFTIKPLGLSFRSHIFGVTLGLGIISTTDLVQAAWFWTTQAHSVYSPIFLCGSIGYIIALGIWATYVLMPEPERRMILLPTTSPFFHWNRIAEALGDAPGQVAIGFKPSMISPTEVKVMTAMSKAAAEREREADQLAHARAEAEAIESETSAVS
jgi:hypothetical protein